MRAQGVSAAGGAFGASPQVSRCRRCMLWRPLSVWGRDLPLVNVGPSRSDSELGTVRTPTQECILSPRGAFSRGCCDDSPFGVARCVVNWSRLALGSAFHAGLSSDGSSGDIPS